MVTGFVIETDHLSQSLPTSCHLVSKHFADSIQEYRDLDSGVRIFYTNRLGSYNAMVEASRYIIDKFYGGDSIAALAKNKTKDQPPNLKALIDKIRRPPKADKHGAPSIGWFYNSVNLAAHEEICAQRGLQTFGIFGHNHNLTQSEAILANQETLQV